ncbi:MAG: hypothetical protein V1834_02560 [Candidatus Micrarchaeota archaeon]
MLTTTSYGQWYPYSGPNAVSAEIPSGWFPYETTRIDAAWHTNGLFPTSAQDICLESNYLVVNYPSDWVETKKLGIWDPDAGKCSFCNPTVVVSHETFHPYPGVELYASKFQATGAETPFRLLDSQYSSLKLQEFYVAGVDVVYNGQVIYPKGTLFAYYNGAFKVSKYKQVRFVCSGSECGSSIDLWQVPFLKNFSFKLDENTVCIGDIITLQSSKPQSFRFYDDETKDSFAGVIANTLTCSNNDGSTWVNGNFIIGHRVLGTPYMKLSEFDKFDYLGCSTKGGVGGSTSAAPLEETPTNWVDDVGLPLAVGMVIAIALIYYIMTSMAPRFKKKK